MIVDADAHVVETPKTWDYLDGSDKNFVRSCFSRLKIRISSTGFSTARTSVFVMRR